MKNIKQLLNKQNWVQYLDLVDDVELTNNAKADYIVRKIKEAINYTQCCETLKSDKKEDADNSAYGHWFDHERYS